MKLVSIRRSDLAAAIFVPVGRCFGKQMYGRRATGVGRVFRFSLQHRRAVAALLDLPRFDVPLGSAVTISAAVILRLMD